MRGLLVGVVILLLTASGCFGGARTSVQGSDAPAPGGGSNTTTVPSWVAPEKATIRPGVRIGPDGGTCTSNFIFYDNQSEVFIGVAAHCFVGAQINESVSVQGATRQGRLAYSSWITQKATCGGVNSAGGAACDMDFALVRLDPEDRGRVSPAMLHFGGPVGLAKAGTLKVDQCVQTYGNTALRQGIDASNHREGKVRAVSGDQFSMVLATPGVPGDSGSGVLVGGAKAAGILVTLNLLPDPGHNSAVILEKALAFAREKAGLDVQLGTAPALQAPVLAC